jgi:hypothetical protein
MNFMTNAGKLTTPDTGSSAGLLITTRTRNTMTPTVYMSADSTMILLGLDRAGTYLVCKSTLWLLRSTMIIRQTMAASSNEVRVAKVLKNLWTYWWQTK